MMLLAECIQINEYRIAIHLSRIRNLQMVRIGEHIHNLLLHIVCTVGKVNTVVQRLAHLRLSVNTRKPQTCLIGRKQHFRLHQSLPVNGIEFPHDLLGLLQHRKLVFPYRHRRSFKRRDIRCLTDRVGEKSHRNACLKISHLNLGFNGRISL